MYASDLQLVRLHGAELCFPCPDRLLFVPKGSCKGCAAGIRQQLFRARKSTAVAAAPAQRLKQCESVV